MRVQFGHSVVIGGFDIRFRFRGDTEGDGRFSHAASGVQRQVAAFFARHLRQGKQPKLLQNKVEIIFVKILAIMHGRAQQPLTTEHFHD